MSNLYYWEILAKDENKKLWKYAWVSLFPTSIKREFKASVVGTSAVGLMFTQLTEKEYNKQLIYDSKRERLFKRKHILK